jgi:hypothetical protein
MSSRNIGLRNSSTGAGTPYQNIFDLVQDREQIGLFADTLDVSHRNVHKDSDGRWAIQGQRAYLQSWGDLSSYLLCVAAHSVRQWSSIKRRAKAFGWELTQDGDAEGCFRISLPNEVQAEYLRPLLGLRRRRKPRSHEIVNNKGVSVHKDDTSAAPIDYFEQAARVDAQQT